MPTSTRASSANKTRDDNSPALVSMGSDDVADDARPRRDPDIFSMGNAGVDNAPVFLNRAYVPTYANMNTLGNWVAVCSKTQQISGNNRNLLPKNMVVGQHYIRNVVKAIFYHVSVPYNEDDLDEWVTLEGNEIVNSDDVLYDISNRSAHALVADCINLFLDQVEVIHVQTNMPSAWADVLRVSTVQLDMYFVVTKVYPCELEPGYNRVLNGPGDYTLRIGFFDIIHRVFYPCNETGTSVFVGTSYRRFLFDTKKRKGITHDLNLMMRSKVGMYPWVDAKGKPHYRVCAAAQIFRINRHHE